MKKFLRYASAGIIVLLISGFVIADTLKQGESQMYTDGDMELAGTTSFTAGNSATLSKETGAVEDGSQVLKVAYNGTNNPFATQIPPLTTGVTYRCSGWARCDGTATPYVYCGSGSAVWTGTTSTSWQHFDVTNTATATSVLLQSYVSGAGYCEFDDVFVTEYVPPAKDTETQVLVDGDMEAAGVGDWTVGGSATLTKESGAVDDGSQVLRVTYNGSANPSALQGVLTVGNTYRITGCARGDGTSNPIISSGVTNIWTGTTSTDWQCFDTTWEALYIFSPLLLTSGSTYTEWDDVVITEYAPSTKSSYDQILTDGDMEEDGTDVSFFKKFNFTTAADIAADGGTITGALTYACEGADFDGSNDYITYDAPAPFFASTGEISIVVEFTPDFNYNDGVQHQLVDSTLGSRYLIVKDSTGRIQPWLGDQLIGYITGATYGSYWNQNGRNVFVLSSKSGDTSAWLNGNQIMTNNAQAWTPATPTTIYIGARYDGDSSTLFDGEINSVMYYSGLLDGTDAQNLYDEVDTDDWTLLNNACLSKQSGGVEDGSQILRIAYDGTNYPQIAQYVQTIGNRYRVTGWCRGDGTNIFTVRDGGVNVFVGTSSTDWQYFDVTYTATADNLRLVSGATAAGYSECDDVMVTELD